MPAMKDIKGYEGLYTLSEDGEVWSLTNHKFRKLAVNMQNGYLQLALCKYGVTKNFYVHRLVALAYLGDPPIDKPLALHKDGNKLNCHFSNIYWGDKSENGYDTVKHGAHWAVNKTHCKRGHLLEEPNLVFSAVKKGFRNCRTCAAARTYASRNPEHTLEYWATNKFYPIYKPTND